MTIFDMEVRERKQLAQQAKYRKRGSKSKKCSLPSDHLTQKKWKELNSRVMSYQLNKPVSWREFKEFPKHIQIEYLANLIQTYNANSTSLAQMFCVTSLTVRRHIETNNLGIVFHVGKRMTAEQREGWEKFIAGEAGESDAGSEVEQQEPEPTTSEAEESVVPTVQIKTGSMSMKRFSVQFSGRIDAAAIANSITGIIGPNAIGEVEVTVWLGGEE